MNMIVLRSDILFVILSYITLSDGFLFGGKKDCLISNWGVWSKPFGFGVVTRERAVLRHPTNGGKACPKLLVESQISASKPTIKKTAMDMVNHFVKRGAHITENGKKVGQLRDLLIIVDASGSIGSSGFSKAKTQLAELLALLCPVSDPFKGYQQAALIQYSSRVKEVFDFNDKTNTVQIQNAIKNLTYTRGSTCTDTAFQHGKLMFDSSKGMRKRSDVKQEVLIISDGASNCGGDAVKAAKMLQKTADVYGLVIGRKVTKQGKKEMLSYVSAPINEHLFGVEHYQDLDKLLTLVKLQLNQPGAVPCAHFDI